MGNSTIVDVNGIAVTDAIRKTIISTNSFVVGEVVYLQSPSISAYGKAIATNSILSEVVGVVNAATNTEFTMTIEGVVTGMTGLSAGCVYFLSDTIAGTMTTIEPTASGHVSKPLMVSTSTTEGYVFNWRGQIKGAEVAIISPPSPIGSIMAWPSDSLPPVSANCLECNGSPYSSLTYAALFSIIGYTYGGSAGTFLLPDYRGRFLRAWDHSAGVEPAASITERTNRGDGVGLDHVGTKQIEQFKTHTHTTIGKTGRTGNFGGVAGGTLLADMVGGVDDQTMTYAGGNETRPVNINVMYLIKYA